MVSQQLTLCMLGKYSAADIFEIVAVVPLSVIIFCFFFFREEKTKLVLAFFSEETICVKYCTLLSVKYKKTNTRIFLSV